MTEINLKAAVQAVMAAEVSGHDGHPSPDELMRYHAGELASGHEDRVLKHLAVCPECARAVLDMASFPNVEPNDPKDRVTADDVSRSWQRFHERLAAQAPATETRPAEVTAAPAKGADSWLGLVFSSPRIAWATAGVLLAATLALTATLLFRRPVDGPVSQPSVNVTLAEVVPEDEGVIRATGGQTVRVPGPSESVLLTLALADPRTYPEYELAITTAAEPQGETLWESSELKRSPEGIFVVQIPRDFLPAGRYRIEVRGRRDGERVLLATYGVNLEHEPRSGGGT